MSALKSLKLQHFRCYHALSLENLSQGMIAITGENGAGKTNILEAISLLSPGRGLRGARVMDIQQANHQEPWAVAGLIQGKYGEETRLGTGLDPNSKTGAEKRTIRINGQNQKGQNSLGQYVSCVWLTPQMDRLFIDSARERRKFLDRLVFAFDPGHAGRVTRYDNALSQRSKLLRDGLTDNAWIGGLEKQMAETGIAIAAARLDFVQRLQTACNNGDHTHFPLAQCGVTGLIENLLQSHTALDVEERFLTELAQSRNKDGITGGAQNGPHKSDLSVIFDAKNMDARQCSTGEQKALLIGIILAHARLVKAERGTPPILLLDEVPAHLDDARRGALYEILHIIGAQCWMTGTERTLFSDLKNDAQFFEVNNAMLV